MTKNINNIESTKILAKDTELGKTYKSLVMKYQVTVLRKEENNIIVKSILQPDKEISIPGDSELWVIKEDLDKVVDSKVVSNVSLTDEQTKGETESMAQNKHPRSTIIDIELLKYKKGDDVPWNKIADKVITAGNGVEADRRNIINQSRVRFKWYTEQGKVNSQSPDGKKAKEAKKAAVKKTPVAKAKGKAKGKAKA